MVVSILTLFPEIYFPFLSSSIISRAQNKKHLQVHLINIRDFGVGRHKQVDDHPYGGGAGMLLKVDVLYNALQSAKLKISNKKIKERVILMDPTGSLFNQTKARKLAIVDHIIIICGHYEGVDYRINKFIDEKISIGRYILTGGEIPSLVIVDAVTRLIPGVLSNPISTEDESYSQKGITEPPQFTRPFKFKNQTVPSILLSGNHHSIKKWRSNKSVK